MAEKIKVLNLARNVVRVNLTKLNGKVMPINPDGFALLSEDELSYLANTSKAFELGILKVADVSKLPDSVDIPTSPNALSEEDIAKLLKTPQNKLASALEDITSIQVVQKILEMAKEADKSVKFVKVIEDKLEALRG